MNDNKMGDRGRCRGRGLECSDIDIVDVVALDLWLWEDVKKSNADESEFPCCVGVSRCVGFQATSFSLLSKINRYSRKAGLRHEKLVCARFFKKR